MAEIKRTALFGRLGTVSYKAMESATVLCKMRGNPYVELVHWLQQVLQLTDSDIHRIVKYAGLDPSRIAADVTASLDKLPRGATAISDFSPHLEEAVERGWLYASLLYGEPRVRTGHMILGMLKTPGLRNVFTGLSREFAKLKGDDLSEDLPKIVQGSPEDSMDAQGGTTSAMAASSDEGGTNAPGIMGKQEALARFSVDLTERALKGEIDPIVGRDAEIRQIIDILMRRRQNNPILTGEAGVGKTAVVEGFALRIAAGDVPPSLKDVVLRTLDLGLLQAGASYKGEFENRLRQIIDEVKASPKPIILFIDEAHTLIGAGGTAGQGDAANLLKPALARGTLRTIAATTWGEYKKYIEKDPALTRRFQVVKIEEPDEEKAVQMIRGLAPVLEAHHRVLVLDEALEAAARLSHRYIPSRQLPDKAVSLIDTACARVAISQHAMPARVEDCRRKIEGLETELRILDRESSVGIEHGERRLEIETGLDNEKKQFAVLEVDWNKERDLVTKILALRNQLQPPQGDGESKGEDATVDRASLLDQLRNHEKDLTVLQGENPLILPSVDRQAVAAVLADWTGIPVGRMVKNEIQAVLSLANSLEKRVVGQQHALDAIARRIQTSRAGLDNPSKPIGVFLLAGPSGVGKTETALALAETLYGGEGNLITINMSEFQEAHTVSTLKGSPPGYVGYGEGGVLTEAVRRRPYSVVLLDEVEKAHPDVHEIFFQVFDKAIMEDAEGRLIDFKNTIILLTTNVGSDLIMNLCKDPELKPGPDGIAKALRQPLLKTFPAALLGRLVVVPYYPLSDEMLKSIIRLQLSRIENRLVETHGVPFTCDEAVIELIAGRCTEVESGGRMVDAILTQTLLPEISGQFLNRMLDGNPATRVHVGVKDGEFVYEF
ncbi:MAG: type VI secretion system ATPase TssH [Terrimicrobiaceae bacterium]